MSRERYGDPAQRRHLAYCGIVGLVLAAGLLPGTAIGAASQPQATVPSSGHAAGNTLAPASTAPCGTTTELVPAKGFDPRTASATQLLAQDFPAAPTDPAMLRAWNKYVDGYLAGKATVVYDCAPARQANPTYSQPAAGANNWAGYVASGQVFTNVEASWVIPDADSPANTDSYHWVGIGQGSSQAHPLVQAGSSTNSVGAATIWIEIFYPNDPVGIDTLPNKVFVGDDLYVHVQFNPNGTVGFHLIDYTAMVNVEPMQPQSSAGMSPDSTSEWITEWVGGKLADFGSVQFGQDNASTGGAWLPLGTLAHRTTTMTDASGNVMCSPSALNGNQQFTDTWKRSS